MKSKWVENSHNRLIWAIFILELKKLQIQDNYKIYNYFQQNLIYKLLMF